MKCMPIKVYPYYESLGTALYGKEQPSWKTPEPFTERPQMKKLPNSINKNMSPQFCKVDRDMKDAKLSPQKTGLIAQDMDNWMSAAQSVFHNLMSEYSAFQCQVNTMTWEVVEKDIRSLVKEDAFLMFDAAKGMLTISGRDDDMKRIRGQVDGIVLKAMKHTEQQEMSQCPDQDQEEHPKAAQDMSLDMSQKLTTTGLSKNIDQTNTFTMSKRYVNFPACLLHFLSAVDPMDLSKDLFISQGISAVYTIDNKGVFLSGSSDRILTDAESKMKAALSHETVDVEDKGVLKLPCWMNLKQQLLNSYNLTKKMTVIIQMDPEIGDRITVSGLVNPVTEVSRSLREFFANYSRVQETIRVQSCAVVQFIKKKKHLEWSTIAKENYVSVSFDDKRPTITISGAHPSVQNAKLCLKELTSALCTDTLTVDKPGAKKYFQSQGSMFLSTMLSEFGCLVLLCPEIEDEVEEEEEEEENYKEGTRVCYCKVQTSDGVLVSVSRADICAFNVDAVVSVANKDLQHIGGLAMALLKAAEPQLQKVCNDYVAKNGRLRPGDAVVIDSFNLPCKHLVHAVGPRFISFDKKTAVMRLKTVVKESLKQAAMANCSSVALPAISSGVFGFPIDLCAETIAQAVREYCDSLQGPGSLKQIHLVDNKDKTVRALASAVKSEFNDLQPTMTVPQYRGSKSRGASGHLSGHGRGREKKFNQGRGRGKKGLKRLKKQGRGSELGYLETKTAEGLRIVLQTGNIQDQATDVIISTVSENMELNQGLISAAMLKAAGKKLQLAVRSEAKGATTQRYGNIVITDAFKLSCRKVFHVVCPFWDNGDGEAEGELVSIIRFCLDQAEKLQLSSLSLPAVGTGKQSFPRDVVSRLLLREIFSFSSGNRPQHLRTVVVVLYPTDTDTIQCFTRELNRQREASDVDIDEPPPGCSLSQSQQLSDSVISLTSMAELGSEEEYPEESVLQKETFEPAVFQLCADSSQAVTLAKRKINEQILSEQHTITICDPYINQLSQTDVNEINALQEELMVIIEQEMGVDIQDPQIHLEGLTTDVYKAESAIRDIIRKVEKEKKALAMSGLVEWQYKHQREVMVPFDIYVSLQLEEAFQNKQKVMIKIQNESYSADPEIKKAVSPAGRSEVELLRKELKNDYALPSHWADMKGDLVKLCPLTRGTQEYTDVERNFRKTGLTKTNIIKIERVQNPTLWQSYSLMKKQLEMKNKHTNNEQLLFHGTGSNSIDLINTKGFNRSYAGRHGASCGKGSYFAVDPAYSAQGYAKPDTVGHKRMYQARVLVGDYTLGRSGIITPPAKSGNAADLYDSVTDNTRSPTMFIIFSDIQAYPEYLITFT
ncbi:protein mono-ADP-ribosyltransferase PARP14-like [Pholidichthys leucotaenia]